MKFILSLLLLSVSVASMANEFKLVSQDIVEGKLMPKAHEYTGFGCKGEDLSPQLSWSGAPKGTKSYAITLYDPDAPTGSGWWHWQFVNIPVNVNSVPRGAGDISQNILKDVAIQIENDYGVQGFGGACPPVGDKPHRYQFTVYALSVEKINVSASASGALVGYMIKSNALASTSIEALYRR